jgi:hypothetical protein
MWNITACAQRIPILLIPFVFTSPYSPFSYFRMPILSFPL